MIAAEPFDGPDALALTDAYRALKVERFPGGYDPDRGLPALQHDLEPPAGIFLIARSDDVAVGCGGLKTYDATTGEIKHMFVDPAHRGHGIGGEILQALEDHAVTIGLLRAVLDTSEHLPEAIALYRRAGYSETAPYNANPYATHWFAKHLTSH